MVILGIFEVNSKCLEYPLYFLSLSHVVLYGISCVVLSFPEGSH